MWLTRVSISRPLFALMVISGFVLIGLVAWTRLGVDLWPPREIPYVNIGVHYPGASPEAVDALVTSKITDAVSVLNDVDSIQSTSVEGGSNVLVIFTDRAPREVSIDVERRVNAVRNQLPAGVDAPVIRKVDPSDLPVVSLGLGGSRSLAQLQQLAKERIQPRLEALHGVGHVALIGGLTREIQVQVSGQKLEARGLAILQVSQAISSDNLDAASGTITQNGRDWTIRVDSLAKTPAELNGIRIATTASGLVYVGDVATVIDTYKLASSVQRSNGQPAVGIAIAKQTTASTIEVANAVRQSVDELAAALPPDVSLQVVSDTSVFIRRSLEDVRQELGQAIVLTGLVLLLFLHALRSTLIVLLAIPCCLIATLGVMLVLGFGLNLMSLMGLTLTVGILVDDSIVVLENIFRHLRIGEGPREAALNGRSEIGFAAIAITLVDVIVFAPIAFISGLVGQFFRQFGLVIVTATLLSLFVSFTLTPLLASCWYRQGQSGDVEATRAGVNWNPLVSLARVWNAGYLRLERGYERLLETTLRQRWAAIGVGLGSFAAGLALLATGLLSTEFLPNADPGQLAVNIEMPPGTTLEVTDAAARRVEQQILAWPEAKTVFSSVGVGAAGLFAPREARFARIDVQLVDRSERRRTSSELTETARLLGSGLPGAIVTASVQSFVPGIGPPIQFRIEGDQPAVLASLANQMAEIVRNVPGTADVHNGAAAAQPELVVHIDRQRAADVGLTPASVAGLLRTELAAPTVSTFRPAGTTGWDLTVGLSPGERAAIEQVAELPIVMPNGASIRLGQVAQLSQASGPTAITRTDHRQFVVVTADLSGRPLGDVVRDIEAGFGRLQVPTGYRISASMDGAAHADYFPGHVPARHQLAFERRIQRQSVTASCWHAGLADRDGIRC